AAALLARSDWYSDFVSRAIARQLNFFSALSLPALPKRSRNFSSRISSLIFATKSRSNFPGKRFKRALFHLRERNEKTGLAIYYDFLDSPNLARNHSGLAGHGFEINDAKRFVDRWTTEDCRMRVELNHTRFIEHLVDPDYAVAPTPRLLNRS